MKRTFFSVILVMVVFGISVKAFGAGTEIHGNLGVEDLTVTSVAVGTSEPAVNDLDVVGDAYVTGAFLDKDGDAGSSGQVLSSTGTGTDWVDPPAAAGVYKTGQTATYGTRDDGALKEGTDWASPRFTDNTDGTVTDNNTGLIWLKNANCFGPKQWLTALSDCNGLADGACGLSDGSSANDWRLPNRYELESLLYMAYANLALSDAAGTAQWTDDNAFTGVQSGYYWSSTTYAPDTDAAWNVSMSNGDVFYDGKTFTSYVWPVRSDN